MQVGNGFGVDLHHLHFAGLFHQILGEHTHSRAHFQHRDVGARVYSVGYAPCYVEVGQEVLAEVLLWFYLLHDGCKGS